MNTKNKAPYSKKHLLSLFASVFAAGEMNTVTIADGVTLENGTQAIKMSNNVRVVYSKEIEFKAMPIMRFLQFAKQKTELGTQPGLTISMMTYNNLKKGGKLVEGTRMVPQALSSSLKTITVGERGNAVAVSELALKTSFTDVMQDATDLLSRDMALVLDCELRDTLLAGVTNTIYGRLNKSTAKITTRANIVAGTNVMSVTVVKDAVEILATFNAPKWESSYYVCFVHPHQSRDLRDDSAWIEASKYGAPDQLFTGEIGKIDDVRFIETTLMTNGAAPSDDPAFDATLKAGASGAPAATDVFRSVIFGQDTYGYAIGLPIELRDNGVQDYGREHGLAWYAIWGAGVLHPERGVIMETA